MSNKKARQALERIYGKGCMMEKAGIRKIKGIKKQDRQITYHHLRPKRLGGQATVENGANLAKYNHEWLESLSVQQRERINNQLRAYKASVAEFNANGIVQAKEISIDMSECIEIPIKYNRAKLKQDLRRRLGELEI
jgi:hypothetical protein|nr:MAG TPA: hypothetical protein [Caudoviricetes sp.]